MKKMNMFRQFAKDIKNKPYSKEKPMVSVVIPVYKVEKYLEKCLNSIAHQDMKNYEVIVVNDGSPDNCQKIIDNFCNKYRNFKCVVQENKGLGAARNSGIYKAKADTICFIDSDDYVATNYLSEMFCQMEYNNCDMAYCDYYYAFPTGINLHSVPNKLGVAENRQFMPKIMSDIVLHHFAWNKMFRKKLFTDFNIYFPNNHLLFEDSATIPRLFFNAKNCVFVHKALYYYFQRSTSIMSTHSYKRVQDHLFGIAISRAYIDRYDKDDVLIASRRMMHNMLFEYLTWEIMFVPTARENKTVRYDISNIWNQLKMFYNDKLPIKGEPWEKVVKEMVYYDEEIPDIISERVSCKPRYPLTNNDIQPVENLNINKIVTDKGK